MFQNKVILMNGACSEIEIAAAILFAREGAKLSIVGRDEAKLNDVADLCEAVGARPLIIKADVAIEEEANTVVSKTIDEYNKLDILINDAGLIRYAGILDDNLLNVYDDVMNRNIRAVILITNLAVPHIIETKGNIVNISSIPARDVEAGRFFPYFISEAAIHHYTRELAADLEPRGVRVNIVKPEPPPRRTTNTIDIPMRNGEMRQFRLFPIKSDSEENAGLVVFLASDKAKNITGSSCVFENGVRFRKL